ncbi:uncharacterized protein K452DRAFT_126574 [Aplosporella prunicola CBS 121167]|uniref:Zn(2)-C6 fungal-type domain-containing protein n=1 Tax=Aplosporella prunicola CBS 121167 TaxID=1176127 RepID=A0A6A6AY67_9PEZI|nr:uncharacterized protein K452DRAFT_126574 [Aplosporella prunicola CBS 121167]KAF2136720.1 hypothetical protein K452DRAFT_126574 [Aplosporella prunicola CBS 121167]
MDHLDFTSDAFLGFENFDPSQHRYSAYLNSSTWPLPVDHSTMSHNGAPSRRPATCSTPASSQSHTSTAPLHTTGLPYPHQMDPSAMLPGWQFQQLHHHQYPQDPNSLDTASYGTYGAPMQTSPVDYMPTSQAPLGMNTTMPLDPSNNYLALSTPMEQPMNAMPFHMGDFQNELMNYPMNTGDLVATNSVAGSSPTENWLEVRSLSSSDNGWSTIDYHQPRTSFDSYTESHNGTVFNPVQTLHIRTHSDSSQSDVPQSAHSFGSFEEISSFPMHSPQSEVGLDFSHGNCHGHHEHDYHYHSPIHSHPSVSPPASTVQPYVIKQSASSSTSPTSSGIASPPAIRRRKSPTGIATPSSSKVAKTITKKTAGAAKKDAESAKKVGRRRGPLRPDQRQQAHEIRKLRACLRCKFLKKTCDKGDPCGGCQPSHARLWQVPCTRIDIKDIAYFMKDWKADFERHVSLGFSVGNIKGFSTMERPLYITHGYGYYLPITAREVYVRDEKCFGMDWVESIHEKPREFEVTTAKLSAGMEGISHAVLSEYIDSHIDGGFEKFIDEYFEGTYFLTEILKTAYRYYLKSKLPVIRKALKLVVAYNLTLHVTMVEGLSEEESQVGKIETDKSKFFGQTVAPVMINFQVKCALADMWRELQKDILEELSSLYSSVYSGEKLKNWPTIFMLAAVLLAVWEEMQFDCHYRVPDPTAVTKFCNDMESTPVGVIVGLFSAISQKLPSFMEWDTRKHHHLLASNQAVCDAMTEVKEHVTKYESYLKSRSEAKFDRSDFDCLSNKFLSKLVIRAN